MFSKIKLSITIIFMSFLFYSCQKEVKLNNELESLVAEFDLKPMNVSNAPQGVTFKNFNTIAEAKEYLNEVKTIFESKRKKTGKLTRTDTKNKLTVSSFSSGATFSIFTPMSSCGPCGAGKANTETDFTYFSSMNIDFDYQSNGHGGYNINELSTYVSGFRIFQNWTQTGSIKNYSSSTWIMFCIPGTVSTGLTVLGIPFEYTRDHSYFVSLDPCGGTYDITDSPYPCD
jgi:hypothetical protein